MSVKLEEMTSSELRKLISDAQNALVKREQKDKEDALSAARTAAAELGYDLDEIMPSKRKASAKKPAAVKYRHPDNASQTWSGKGRQPKWYKDAIEGGIPKEKMLVA